MEIDMGRRRNTIFKSCGRTLGPAAENFAKADGPHTRPKGRTESVMWWSEPFVDHLHREVRGITVEEALEEVSSPDSDVFNVRDILRRGDSATRNDWNRVVRAAWAAGWTHYPPDLAGRRAPIRLAP